MLIAMVEIGWVVLGFQRPEAESLFEILLRSKAFK